MSAPLPDSGARTEYSTGAVRDASIGKGHFHSIPPGALRRIARRFEDGAKKYSKNNWMKGIALSHYFDSITRHTLAWAEGDQTEDHVGAILWNAAAMDWTEQEILAGRLPAELNDLPYRPKKTVVEMPANTGVDPEIMTFEHKWEESLRPLPGGLLPTCKCRPDRLNAV